MVADLPSETHPLSTGIGITVLWGRSLLELGDGRGRSERKVEEEGRGRRKEERGRGGRGRGGE